LPASSTSTTYAYDASGNQKQLTTSTANEYNSDHLLNKTTTNNSKGLTIENITHYTNDYDNSIANISALKSKYIIQLPIKQETVINNNLKAGNIFLYNANGQPTDVYSYESTNAIAPVLHDASVLVQGNYYPKHHLEYNTYGDIISQNKHNDVEEIYIYGYNNQYPVAKVIGKSYNNAITQSNIDLGVLNNLATSEAIMLTELAKLRTLTGALVTTYTYKPLVGITSETDPQGKTIYYVYDNFNRLKLIKDKDGNILKTFEYKYQKQQ
jgi:YD repeat-containing protein